MAGNVAVGGLAAFAAGIGASAVAVTAFTISTAGLATELKRISDSTDITTDTLSRLSTMVVKGGGDISMTADIAKDFADKLGDARVNGGEMAEQFKKLGVNLNQSTDKALQQTIESLGKIEDKSASMNIGMAIFSDNYTKMASQIAKGSTIASEKGIFSDNFIVQSERMITSFNIVKSSLTTLGSKVVEPLLPLFSSLAEGITEVVDSLDPTLVANFATNMGEIFKYVLTIGKALGQGVVGVVAVVNSSINDIVSVSFSALKVLAQGQLKAEEKLLEFSLSQREKTKKAGARTVIYDKQWDDNVTNARAAIAKLTADIELYDGASKASSETAKKEMDGFGNLWTAIDKVTLTTNIATKAKEENTKSKTKNKVATQEELTWEQKLEAQRIANLNTEIGLIQARNAQLMETNRIYLKTISMSVTGATLALPETGLTGGSQLTGGKTSRLQTQTSGATRSTAPTSLSDTFFGTEDIGEKASLVTEMATTTINTISSAMQVAFDAQMARDQAEIESNKKKEYARIDGMVVTARKRKQLTAKADKEAEDRAKEIQKKQLKMQLGMIWANTATGIAGAWANAFATPGTPPPVALVLAGLSTAALLANALVQTSTINKSMDGLAGGGFVGGTPTGTSMGGDNTRNVNLRESELVLNARQQRNLLKKINDDTGVGGNITVQIMGNVDSDSRAKELEDTLYTMQSNGRLSFIGVA
jgi:hypothetical protein